MAELIWDGKYDSNGARTAPLRVALPFQTVETVNESVQDRQRSLDLFGGGKPSDWRNRLIWGDKKYVLPEPPRVSWRLFSLRGSSDVKSYEVFAGGS
jgi:adenine-specific DNA-methyltransferase